MGQYEPTIGKAFIVTVITVILIVHLRQRSTEFHEKQNFRLEERLSIMKGELNELYELFKTNSEIENAKLRNNFDGFATLFERYLRTIDPSLSKRKNPYFPEWEDIKSHNLIFMNDLKNEISQSEIQELCRKVAVIKFNGGLGTTMKMTGPKGLVSVQQNKTFLDLTIDQMLTFSESCPGIQIPLILMNSFKTNEKSQEFLGNLKYIYENNLDFISSFEQGKYPTFLKNSRAPVLHRIPDNNLDGWYPPGHGEVFFSLTNENSQILENLKKKGIEYLFLSNIDNLGGSLNFEILKKIYEKKINFGVEISKKTPSDTKGGTLVLLNNELNLVERSQVNPLNEKQVKQFEDSPYFNTNNIWVNIDSLDKTFKKLKNPKSSEKFLEKIPIIPNQKKLKRGDVYIQLEIAAASFISLFENSKGIVVDRERFIPVKKTSDLLKIRSNLFNIENGFLKRNLKTSEPTVILEEPLNSITEFEKRIPYPLNLLNLEELFVSGDVTFGENVSIEGKVTIKGDTKRKEIQSGSKLKNEQLI